MNIYQKGVVFHAHFYQPSRENPFINRIEAENDAEPFENWTERIFFDCYKPNIDLGNFRFFSFNIGPTLTMWLRRNYPEYLLKVIEQEKISSELFGTSNAIAQPYHHTILPLDNKIDKETQIKWGIEDYRSIFNHDPEGMWLPETAVDIETLEILASEGIKYTILAPWQAECENLDTTEPYFIELKTGRRMTVYFFDQFISNQVSFNPNITEDGDRFVNDVLMDRYFEFDPKPDHDQIILIASDGELYGHHQKFRDKFISYVFSRIDKDPELNNENLGSWIKRHPSKKEVHIKKNTSWSCHHGIERWRSVCDCTPSAQWKFPLRKGLQSIANKIDDIYVKHVSIIVDAPWRLRNQYIQSLIGNETFQDLISNLSSREFSKSEEKMISNLLEAQYSRLRMFTSCGWFFDDLSRPEPYYNLMHAAFAVQKINQATSIDLTQFAFEVLNSAKMKKGKKTGGTIFRDIYDNYR